MIGGFQDIPHWFSMGDLNPDAAALIFFFEVNYSRDPVVGSPVGKISAGLLVHWWNSYQGISRLSSHLDGDWGGLNSWGSDVSNLSSENSSKSKKHLGLRYLFLHL